MTELPPVRVRTRVPAGAVPAKVAPAAGLQSSEQRKQALRLNVEYRPVASLKPSERNARRHPQKQLQKLAASMRQFGFNSPILIDGVGEVVAGHGRLEAAKIIGLAEVPTISVSHLTEAEVRAFRIADNRLAELGNWDDEALHIEFSFLAEIDLDLPEITGFETAEIDAILEAAAPAPAPDPADVTPELDDRELPVSREGDLWNLGVHRLLNGDAKDPAAYARLLEGQLAQMVFSDPPWNVPVAGHVRRTGDHDEFIEASGEMTDIEYLAFIRTVFGNIAAVAADGALVFICIDWRHLAVILQAGGEAYEELKNLLVWAKTNAGLGSLWRSQHELIPVFKKGQAPHTNNVALGRYGRFRSNVLSYPGVNTFKRGREAELHLHPTPKPVALVKDLIKDCSKPQSIILDCFGGSGTTLIAAEKTQRRGYLIELDPRYVDVTIKRWQDLVGAQARHAITGKTFAEMQVERATSQVTGGHHG